MSISDGPRERLAALGDELVEIHAWLREELAALRADVERHLDGQGGRRPRPLKAHCLSFCSALTRHHSGEDAGAFPALAGAFPELAPTIAKLEEDHELISVVQQDLERLLAGVEAEPDAAEAARVLAALDGLTAILESHFSFEERRIVAALNALTAEEGSTERLLGLPAPGRV